MAEPTSGANLEFRVGCGYDIHRLVPLGEGSRGRPLVLGGVRFAGDTGVVAHSDGDALLHAVADAILGAAGLNDIGERWPDTDPANAGRDSRDFVREAVAVVCGHGWRVENLDAVVILERARVSAHKDAIRRELGSLLRVPVDRVNVKGKTHEGVDAVGEGRAVEVHAVVLLSRPRA
jgi:2-C-methyl-D-erythritol 2,4-cyclodiphosphate synthase